MRSPGSLSEISAKDQTMRISDNEVKKLLAGTNPALVEEIVQIGQESDREADEKLAQKVTQDVMAMGDREEMIADLKARIEAGTYNPTGDEIADTMIRRAIADRIR
ncbi:MAG TPA: flagellar biosynthesis anti-sigma factor FlgM [Fimbriimonadaceae bacterium]|jgi:negative regulator of flagellin synthesis FlgM|nr:flagellar biosynthesis anti-sigma factor FlgM [Fimbriimonadaceae bacterium]